ncbi:hypothetical protein [Phytohabitans houttuyneae]|uniref:Uncharacterized protein n=1 Tax=Phytohabitans houttuyneae TaxID=1076126 RepID=A0A6V8KBS1_9ACTN|nr:hypothetical protein [Phytohabitans houttuyneae]GFJ79426.1 hypothetical protein Phou_036060 [Phytohabitans houttuyneae]
MTTAAAEQPVEIVGTGNSPLHLTGVAIDINGRTATLVTADGVRDIDMNHVSLVRSNGVPIWLRSQHTTWNGEGFSVPGVFVPTGR